jgi:hypothetical protein
LDLLRSIATIGTDGVLTALADFLAMQLALYNGLAVSIELTAAREAEKNRKIAAGIPVAAEHNNAMLTATRAFNTAAACMSEIGPRMVDIAQAVADACGAKTEQRLHQRGIGRGFRQSPTGTSRRQAERGSLTSRQARPYMAKTLEIYPSNGSYSDWNSIDRAYL